MNILHISTPLSWRGGEQQLMYLYEELKALGVNQYLLCPNNSELFKRFPDKEQCFTFNKKTPLSILTGFKIKNICKKNNIDLIHTHDSHAHSKALWAAILYGNKTPMVIHRRVDFPIKKTIFSKIKYNHSCVKSIICVSDAIRNIMLPDIKNSAIVRVVHSGIDLKRFPFQQKTDKLNKLLKLDNSVKIIGNTSAIAPHKDYFTFIDTVSVLLKELHNVHFVIIGEGPLEKEIKDYARLKGLSSHITFLGFRKDVPELLPDFDIFLISSKTEGLGTSILDAFACKVPVVATCAGGIAELVEHHVTGLLAEIGNPFQLAAQVETVLNDNRLRETIIENGYKKLEHYTKNKTAENTLDIYNEILNN